MSDFKELVRRLRAEAAHKERIYDVPAMEGEAADAIEKLSAEVERYRESDLSEAVQRLDETKEAEIERLKRELAEATASRDRLQQVVEAFGDGGEKGPSVWAFIDEWPTLKEKADALDELEAWLRESPLRDANVGPNPDGMAMRGWSCELSEVGEYVAVVDHTTTLAGAIRDAIEKAKATS